MAIYNIHAGHNWNVTGANGYLNETKENRIVCEKVINLLRSEGHTVYDCTDEYGKTEAENLINIVDKCNQHIVDYDISIHFNAFNTQAHGVEVYVYNKYSETKTAQRICDKIASLGFTNRGVKMASLYVLKHTKAKAILVECCFCDNKDDANLYNADKMAKAIVEGVLNKKVDASNTKKKIYRVRKTWEDAKSQIGAFLYLDGAKKSCPSGYNVYDWNGNKVFSNINKVYRIRKSWEDEKSQIGAYSNIENAKKNCISGYTVYDWDGIAIYSK